MKKIKVKIEHWEADEYVLIFAGKVRGQTLSKHNAEFVKNYLQTLDFNDIALSVLGPKEVDEH